MLGRPLGVIPTPLRIGRVNDPGLTEFCEGLLEDI